ncbi:MAG: hypothetical protein AB7P17_12615 [Nitrospirales bacterium]|nr:hypothetical protein [Nitrospirales bacterium]
MTISMLIDRLERFRQDVWLYREMCQRDVPRAHCGTDFVDASGLEAFRDKLRKQVNHLDEYVTALTKGRFQIHVDSRGLQDIYAQAFSDNCRQWHLDTIIGDLEEMIRDLHARPLHEPIKLDDQGNRNQDMKSRQSFGSLGHLGFSSMPSTNSSLHTTLGEVARILQRRIDRPEDHEALLEHVQAIVDHPEITSLLSLPPSQRI